MKKWISWSSVILGAFPFLLLLWPLDVNSGIRYPREVVAGLIPCMLAAVICVILNVNDVKMNKHLTARGALSVVEQYIAMLPFFSAAVATAVTMFSASHGRELDVSIAILIICGIVHVVPISNAIGLIFRLPSLMTEGRRTLRNVHIVLQFIPIVNLIDSWKLLQMTKYEGQEISRRRWVSLYLGLLILLLVSLLIARAVVWWILT